MPNKDNYWTTKGEDGWKVKREGNQRATSLHETQSEAWKKARFRAKQNGGEAFLKGRDGKIRERNSYGNDPYPPKG